MPRRKLEVNSYHVLGKQTQPTLPETLALGCLVKLQVKKEKKKQKRQRDNLSLKRETMRSLSGYMYVSVCVFVFA